MNVASNRITICRCCCNVLRRFIRSGNSGVSFLWRSSSAAPGDREAKKGGKSTSILMIRWRQRWWWWWSVARVADKVDCVPASRTINPAQRPNESRKLLCRSIHFHHEPIIWPDRPPYSLLSSIAPSSHSYGSLLLFYYFTHNSGSGSIELCFVAARLYPEL